MKVLDVSELQVCLNKLTESIQSKEEEISLIEKSISSFIQADSFSGQGAKAIKSFYASCHLPFLLHLKQNLNQYKQLISECSNQLQALEPAHNGFIQQSFLENEVKKGLRKTEQFTKDITNEANRAIRSIQDIVPISLLTDSEHIMHIQRAEQQVENTTLKMEEFDNQQSSSMETLSGPLKGLHNYVVEMSNRLGGGDLSIRNFSSRQLTNLPKLTNIPFHSGTQNTTNNFLFHVGDQDYLQFYNRQDVYGWMGLDYGTGPTVGGNSETINQTNATPAKEENEYYAGDSVEMNGFTFQAGAGRMENDWSGYGDGDGQFGGKSTVTGIHAGVAHDTTVIDSSLDQDIGKASVQASIGGENIFPLLKADGAVYHISGKAEFDSEIPVAGGSGGGAQANIASGKAYAGVDNNSIGIALKAALVEGEVNGILPIPFTDYNIKGTVGGSVAGFGGEAKIGKETVLDLRALLGVKLGVSFEKDK